MFKGTISKISVIKRNKERVLNLVVIRIAGKPAVIRTFKQFLTDLQESFLISDDVTSMNDEEVREVLADLQGGTVSGEITFHEAGDRYVIDENHPAVTNPEHRLYGKVSVGEPMRAEKDGARVTEGFLSLKREATAQAIHKSSTSYAKMRMKFEGFLSHIDEENTSTATVEEEFDIDEKIANEIVGGVEEDVTEVEEPEVVEEEATK